MASRHEHVYQLAQDWVRWLDTRKFLGRAEQKNILAKLIPPFHASKGEPDGPMSQEISAFNVVISGLDAGSFIPFIVVYCDYKPKPIKERAYQLGKSRDQFYENAHKTALNGYRTARQLVEINETMQRKKG